MTSIDRKALYYIHTTVLHSNKQRIAEYTYRAPESTFGTTYHARREACTLLVMFTPKFVTKKGTLT